MNVTFAKSKLKKTMEDDRLRKKRYGQDMSEKIDLRLNSLRAAASLSDFWPPRSGPEQCHQLDKDLAGTFSMDVKQPYRLLFDAVDVERMADEEDQSFWSRIKSVEIVGVKDTHE